MAKSQLLSGDDVARALTRIAHEIVERNHDLATISIIGLQTGGAPFVAGDSPELLGEICGEHGHRSACSTSPSTATISRAIRCRASSRTLIDHDLSDRTVVLVDDVLFTGRTIRAALNALRDWGRPASVQLAVLVDRGHRELPIRPDYVGKNLPTSRDEDIKATLEGVWIGTRS